MMSSAAVSTEGMVTQAFDLESVLAAPLIIGTSVSADSRTLSPAKRLALRFTDEDHIKIIASGGQTGLQTLSKVRSSDLVGRSVVIGVDLLFWDSLLADVAPSIKALKALVKKTAQLDLPLILGEVPELLPGFQPGRAALNLELKKISAADRRCQIIPFDQLFKQISKDGKLKIKGRVYTLPQLLPDGLHLSPIAGEYIADLVQSLVNAQLKH